MSSKRLLLSLFTLIALGCSNNSKVWRITRISPYKIEYFINEEDKKLNHKSIVEYYALESTLSERNELKKIMDIAKSMTNRVPKDAALYKMIYYKYEQGKIDENFVNDFNTETNNISLIGEPLYSIQWNFGKFTYIIIHQEKGRDKLINDLDKLSINYSQ